MNNNTNGIILLDKLPGPSSTGLLNQLKKKLPGTKIGHAGTLDPFASGLLIVMLGKATRLNFLLMGADKKYDALLEFGKETDSLDPEGKIISTAQVPPEDRVYRQINLFQGQQEQLPPAYSALKIQGKRAYKLARAGKKVELKARKITIHQLNVLSYQSPLLEFTVHCSKGTYVRSLARDIGRACQSYAYLKSLHRTQIGNFKIEEAVKLEDFSVEKDIISLEKLVEKIPELKTAVIKKEQQQKLNFGKQIQPSDFTENPPTALFACLSEQGKFLALLEFQQGKIRYRFVC